jgi:hypothetical protein
VRRLPAYAIMIRMRNKTLLAGVLVSAALLLGACGSDGGGTTGDGDGGPVGDGNPNHDPCLIGTWQLDVQDVADQLKTLMSLPGAEMVNEGTVTVTFGSAADIAYANTLTITVPMSDMSMVGTAVYSGTANIAEWTAKDGSFTASAPTGDFDIDLTFTVGGTTVPAPMQPPALGLHGDVPFAYTCSGDSASLSGPAPAPTWHLNRA